MLKEECAALKDEIYSVYLFIPHTRLKMRERGKGTAKCLNSFVRHETHVKIVYIAVAP